MMVYHGSVEEIRNPDVNHSFRNLDFGNGFYVTTVKEQAERWAKRKSLIESDVRAVVSMFDFKENSCLKIMDFGDDYNRWIDFVCNCRDGKQDFKAYDIIIGKVADDKVYRVVDMYRKGIWDKERTIKEMKVYDTYDQLAFISQEAIDKCIRYVGSYEVE